MVHRPVRLLEHGFRIPAVIGADADTNAHGDMDLVPTDEMWYRYRSEQLLRAVGRRVRMLDFRKQYHELVATQAAYGVRSAYTGRQALRHRLQQSVAYRMPQGVIDEFKAIQIQKQQRDFFPVTAAERYRLGKPVSQQQPVRQAGEKVVLCLVGHSERKGSRVADIVENQYRTNDLAVPVVDGCGRIFDPGLIPIAPDKHTMDVQAHDLVLLYRMLRQVVN